MFFKIASVMAVLMLPPTLGTLYGMTQGKITDKPHVVKFNAYCPEQPNNITITRPTSGGPAQIAASGTGDCWWIMPNSQGEVWAFGMTDWCVSYGYGAPGGPGEGYLDSSTTVVGTYDDGSVITATVP